MGKVKQAIDEVRIEIEDILSTGDVDVEDVKIILKNKYFFKINNNNPYYTEDKTIEDLYLEVRKQNEEY